MSVADTGRRPGRRWYALSGAVAVLGVAAALAVFVAGIWWWTGEFPKVGARVDGAAPVRVDLLAGQPKVLYVSPDTALGDWQCGGEVAGTPIRVSKVRYTFTFFSGGRTWAARYEIEADRDGSGTLTCVSMGASSGAVLAVGDKPHNGRILRKLGGVVAASGCLAMAALAAGGGVALVVWRRRRPAR